jgi:hypothetical protein
MEPFPNHTSITLQTSSALQECLKAVYDIASEVEANPDRQLYALERSLDTIDRFLNSERIPALLLPSLFLTLRVYFTRYIPHRANHSLQAFPAKYQALADLIYGTSSLQSYFAMGCMYVAIPAVRRCEFYSNPPPSTHPALQTSCAAIVDNGAPPQLDGLLASYNPVARTAYDLILFHNAHSVQHKSTHSAEAFFSSLLPLLEVLDSVLTQHLNSLLPNIGSPASSRFSVLHFRQHHTNQYQACTAALRRAFANKLDKLCVVTSFDLERASQSSGSLESTRAAILDACRPSKCQALTHALRQLVDFIAYAITYPVLDSAAYCITFPYSAAERLLINIKHYAISFGRNPPHLCFLPHGLPQACMRTAPYDSVIAYTADPAWRFSFPTADVLHAGWPESLLSRSDAPASHSRKYDITFYSQLAGADIHNIPSLLSIGLSIIQALLSLPTSLSICVRLRDEAEMSLIPSTLRYAIQSHEHITVEYLSCLRNKGGHSSRVMVGSSTSALLHASQTSATCIQIVDNVIAATWPFCLATEGYYFNLDMITVDMNQTFRKAVRDEVQCPLYPVRRFSSQLLASALRPITGNYATTHSTRCSPVN